MEQTPLWQALVSITIAIFFKNFYVIFLRILSPQLAAYHGFQASQQEETPAPLLAPALQILMQNTGAVAPPISLAAQSNIQGGASTIQGGPSNMHGGPSNSQGGPSNTESGSSNNQGGPSSDRRNPNLIPIPPIRDGGEGEGDGDGDDDEDDNEAMDLDVDASLNPNYSAEQENMLLHNHSEMRNAFQVIMRLLK